MLDSVVEQNNCSNRYCTMRPLIQCISYQKKTSHSSSRKRQENTKNTKTMSAFTYFQSCHSDVAFPVCAFSSYTRQPQCFIVYRHAKKTQFPIKCIVLDPVKCISSHSLMVIWIPPPQTISKQSIAPHSQYSERCYLFNNVRKQKTEQSTQWICTKSCPNLYNVSNADG